MKSEDLQEKVQLLKTRCLRILYIDIVNRDLFWQPYREWV